MSAGWDGYYSHGGSTIVRHEWEGLLKRGGQLVSGGLEDDVLKREDEGRERQPSRRGDEVVT